MRDAQKDVADQLALTEVFAVSGIAVQAYPFRAEFSTARMN